MNVRARALALGAVLVLCGCASTGSIHNDPLHAGVGRTFEVDYPKVLEASREALVEGGLAIERASELDANNYMIIGKKGMSGFSWGELVRVVVTKTSPKETTVRVHTKRKLKTNITAKGDYAESLLSNIELKLRS